MQDWTFIGTAPGTDRPSNVVIRNGSTVKKGKIYEVIVGTNFWQNDAGYWGPEYNVGHIAKYEIDCKYHTYYEAWWYFVSRPPEDFESITADEEWDPIKPNTAEAVTEAYLCKAK